MPRPSSPIGARLQAGGSIRPETVYVERHADSELAAALRVGEICHVLAPRQMGKSSLCGRVARQLRSDGVTCIQLDLNLLGGQKSVPDLDGWFYSLIKELSRQLGWPREFTDELWQREAQTTAPYKWSRFLMEEVVRRNPGRTVFLFDEIDTILTLPFSCDDFFAVVRAMFNARPEHPELQRIAVCFVGVAAASELMQDPTRTPLNVGVAIALEDFTRQEVTGFAPALETVVKNSADWLDAIYSWTAGHPYMTHKLCAELCKRPPAADIPTTRVQELVQRHFLQTWRTSEPNLQYAERRIDSRPNSGILLRMYRRIVEGQSVPENRNDAVQQELWLSGICHWLDGSLTVRNRIFATVFDWAWVHGKESVRFLDEALEPWVTSGKRQDLVLAGVKLDAARTWAQGRNDLTAEEQEFLLVSLEAARATSTRWSLQVAVGSLATALLVCASLFYWQFGVWQKKNAVEQELREVAQQSELRETTDAEELRRKNAELDRKNAELARVRKYLEETLAEQEKENGLLHAVIDSYTSFTRQVKKQAAVDQRNATQRLRDYEQETQRRPPVPQVGSPDAERRLREFEQAMQRGLPPPVRLAVPPQAGTLPRQAPVRPGIDPHRPPGGRKRRPAS